MQGTEDNPQLLLILRRNNFKNVFEEGGFVVGWAEDGQVQSGQVEEEEDTRAASRPAHGNAVAR